MSGAIISDSTCLIGLERVGRLNLLSALFLEVVIPPEVEREFGAPLPWLKVDAGFDPMLARALRMQVDGGEAEAIALALRRGLPVILDDRRARLAARNLGLAVIGTLGVLMRAKRAGEIPLIKPVIEELAAQDFFLAPALVSEALRLVGE